MASGAIIYIDNQEYKLIGPVPSAWTEIQSDNSTLYTISNDLVVWNNGRIVQYDNVDVNASDLIIDDGQYTTRAESTNAISVNLATAFPDKWADLTIGKHTLQIRAKNPGNYLDSDLSTAINFYKTVPITVTATNCTAAANNPTEFPDVGGDETILTFNKKTGYTLPETIVITGVAGQNIGYSWTVADSGTYAELKILKAFGDIAVTVTGVATSASLYVGEDIIIPQIVRN